MLPGKSRKLRLILKYPGARSFAGLRCTARRLKLPRSCFLPRARGTPVGDHRIDDGVDKLIAEVIQEVYLTQVRAKKEEVVRMVDLRCAALGLTPPSHKPVLARLKELDPGQVAKARLQKGETATQTDLVPGSYQIQPALDIVQIDHRSGGYHRRGRSQLTSPRSAMAHAGSRCGYAGCVALKVSELVRLC